MRTKIYRASLTSRTSLLLVVLSALLSACATPVISLKNGDISMELNSTVPQINSAAYSPAGNTVASGGFDDIVRVWDLGNAKEKIKLKGHKGAIIQTSYAPDGKHLASLSMDGTLRLWDITNGTTRWSSTGYYSNGFQTLAYAPDGKLLLGCAGDVAFVTPKVKIHDASSGTIIKEFVDGRSAVFSSDGQKILLFDSKLTLVEISSGNVLWQSNLETVGELAFSPDANYVLATITGTKVWHDSKIVLIDARIGYQLKEFGKRSNSFGGSNLYDLLKFSPDSKLAITGDRGGIYRLWSIPEGALIREFKQPEAGVFGSISSADFSPDGKRVIISSLGSIRLLDVATGDELATMISFKDGEWLVVTPNGYYNASEKGDQYLNVQVGGKPYSIAQLRESFYRPDLVKVALSGGSLKGYPTLANVKRPPLVSIVQTPSSASTESLKVTLKLEDQGGGIGDVRLFLNGSAIMLDSSRSLKAVPKNSSNSVTYRSYTIKLSSGSNTIRAIAFNADNSMQSNDTVHQVVASFSTSHKPILHALVIGIQEFRNPKLQLKYAVADANLFAETLRKGATGFFNQVQITTLTERDTTTHDNINKVLQGYRAISPDDLFILYIASHGTVDEGEYFLITSNVGALSTQKLKSDALSQIQLKELVANIPSTKKLIVIDTCNAGQLGQAMQTALLTRGMSEDTAMKVLSRAVGSTILSASTSVQEALEGYQGHGLFTWALVEGLLGKADKGKTGYVKTTDLAAYVEDEVPSLAEKVFKRAQFPTISISGQGFPVGRVP